ncbi:MAG: carboxymuconolactone decarboxylase family protein [Pseudomonadota bacterium]
MATVPSIKDEDAAPDVKRTFDDIRTTRKTDQVNAIWRMLGNYPEELDAVWTDVKRVMGAPQAEGGLDPLTRELIYIAVSATNQCGYCVHSHTAAARQKGMTDRMHKELVQIVSLAARTNQIVAMLQVPIDPAFDLDR